MCSHFQVNFDVLINLPGNKRRKRADDTILRAISFWKRDKN